MIEEKGDEFKKRGVAIAYDSRHFSPEFVFESAAVLAKHDIKSYVFESRSEEHTSELQSLYDLVCRLLLEKKK